LSGVIPLHRKPLSAILLSFLVLTALPTGLIPRVYAGTRTSAINSALNWLITNQHSDGSYGSFTEHETAPAANALWIRYRDVSSVQLSYTWLKNQIQNSSIWFWGGGGNIAEADIPGEILYSFDVGQHLQMLNYLSSVATNLTKFQQSNGGFLGYYDTNLNKQVTSSVDTAMALWGLINAKSVSVSKVQAGVSYLLSLQNSDGSFNLTSTVRSNSLYSLGPEPISITALVLLLLKDASYIISDAHVSSALNFLAKEAGANFGGHVYAASLSALAFTAFDKPTGISMAVSFVLSHQNPDGGFSDIIRSSAVSNPLDTGWAAVALQLAGLIGDVNLDGTVNILDLVGIAIAFQAIPGSPTWNPHADVDADGVVNILDLTAAAVHFGQTADSL
jgi:prenyltransferase beta subunit